MYTCYTLKMYKYLIIGIAAIFTLSGNYYIRKAGGEELISRAVSGEVKKNETPISIDEIVGLYICDIDSGCKSRQVLLLKNDQTVELLPISSDSIVSDEIIEELSNELREDSPVQNNIQTTIISTSTEFAEQLLESTTTETISTTTEITNTNIVIIPPSDFGNSSENNTEQKYTLNLVPESASIIEKGTWDIDVQNILVVTINEHGTSTYEVPQKIIILDVGTNTLSRINFTKNNYINMIKPVFIRQE